MLRSLPPLAPCLRRAFSSGFLVNVLWPIGSQAQGTDAVHEATDLVLWLSGLLALVMVFMLAYGLRQSLFAWQRMWGRTRYPYAGVVEADWPPITVFVAAHNEEAVIALSLQALVHSDYPSDRLRIVVVNDRSTDATASIVDEWVARHPGRIEAFHRRAGKPGKAAALKDAMAHARGDIALVFDADYTPSPGLLRQLVVPFFDPEVGAVMGRVVPRNAGVNLLTRLLDLERSAGYQVDQQARMNLRLVPQYGGTVGGVRCSAVAAVGGWHDDTLAEDTDITYRLLLNGWKTVYTNRSECYEEVPQDWQVRIKQIKRWAKGHNQVMVRYGLRFAFSPYLSWRERLDGLLLLFVFALPPLLLLGWLLALGLYFFNAGDMLTGLISLFALMAYGTLGNFAAFFEIAVAVLLDGKRRRLRLLPLSLLGFVISLFAISSSVWGQLMDKLLGRDMVWDKTVRYRQPSVEQ